jgi:hypothetical protein
MLTLPFLYLPDAITLILLLIVFGLLRKTAIEHIRQELLFIRKEMLLYWINNALDFRDCGYRALRDLIDKSIYIVPGLTPGRLVFINRLQKNGAEDGTTVSLHDPSHEAGLLIDCTANANGRATLRRLQTEVNMELGVFFLMGSLSGWLLLSVIVPKIFRRTLSHRKDHRVDFFFDMVERVLVNIGRKAEQIGHASRFPSTCTS